MKAAILDLGTNTFHLLVVEITVAGKWKPLLKKRVTVKLGQGGINKQLITTTAFKRGVKALDEFSKLIKQYPGIKIHAFGTAALRNAGNGKQFTDEVHRKFGIKVSLITGDEEAFLIYKGVSMAFDLGSRPHLIMDIGGGSVEFIIADAYRIYWKRSFKIGAALLIDKFKPSDPMNSKDISGIISYLDRILNPLFRKCEMLQPEVLIGSAGSFETFASMISHMDASTGRHYGKGSHPVSKAHFKKLHGRLIRSSRNERLRMKGLIKMRVDMIVLASLLLNFVVERSKIRTLKVSAFSLKEGVLAGLIE